MRTVSLHLSNSLNWLVTQAFRQHTIILVGQWGNTTYMLWFVNTCLNSRSEEKSVMLLARAHCKL